MNIELLESFGQNYPEENDGTLDCVTMALTAQFNRFGTLLAVGCNDGRIVVWDFLTRGIAKIIQAHVHPVCSLTWSRTGRKLVSASTDNNVSLWDLLTGDCDQRFRFPSPVLKVQFHPRNENILLVVPMKHAPVVVNVATGTHSIVPIGGGAGGGEGGNGNGGDNNTDSWVASYDSRGKHIFVGNAKGRVTVLSSGAGSSKAKAKDAAADQQQDMKIVASFRVTQQVSSTTAIKSIEFARRGKSFLVNTADRVIRVYRTSQVLSLKDGDRDPEPDQKLQDLVNKTMWKKCCFSGDGEYVCAGSARQHALYIWEKATGTLMKILHGTKGEILLDVVWHPVRPIVASISQGVVTVWAQQQVENWSAFAPDFKELDENVDYEERESEFDLEDEDRSTGRPGADGDAIDVDADDPDRAIDVDTNKPIPAFCSSDEEDEDPDSLLYLPIAPEIEDPEEHWVPGVDSVSPGGGGSDSPTGGNEPGKRGGSDAKENASPTKRKRTKTTEIVLPNAPKEETHPMVAKGAKDKSGANKRPMGRPKGKDKGKK